eukprot:1150858-Pelagomonas_calceolata.AAC.2
MHLSPPLIEMINCSSVCFARICQMYDDGDEFQAALVWWALAVFGQPKRQVLRGGFKAWLAEQGKEELYEPCPLKISWLECRSPVMLDISSKRPCGSRGFEKSDKL